MATSAFKSTTRRTSIGASSSGGDDPRSSSNRAHRRSRSLSRVFRGHASDLDESRADYTSAPKGKFVNTVRGSAFQEVSLDDLALEFFSLKDNNSSNNNNNNDEGRESSERARSRSSRRGSEIGRWASDTASSQRRGRSVSRNGAGGGEDKSLVSNSSADKTGTSAANARRRRSVSVARSQISDSENEADRFRSSSSCSNVKNIEIWKSQTFSSQKTPTSGDRPLQKSLSQQDLIRLHDGYSSHSSALTDDETNDPRSGKNGTEKTIRAVYAQKRADHPIEEAVNSGLYEAMRTELRCAVAEIRSELGQAVVRNDAALANDGYLQSGKPDALQVVSAIRKSYATKLEQSQKRKQDLLAEMMLEEQRGRELSKIVRELLPDANNSAVQKPSRARKRSSDRNRMSKRLTEEAEKYLEDFISNMEETDLSSFDGERSDATSSLGGPIKSKDSTRGVTESFQSPAGSNLCPVGTDGVIFPWLQWETSNDGSLNAKNKLRTPVTPKTLQWDAEQDVASRQDPSTYSISSHGSWSPRITANGHPSNTEVVNGEKKSKDSGIRQSSHFDMSEYLMHKHKEEVLFERYKERSLIHSGGLLICTNIF